MTAQQRASGDAGVAPPSRAWWIAAFLMALVALALAWLVKVPCSQAQPSGTGWVDFDQRPLISACYNDVVLLYQSRQLDTGVFPYAVDGSSGHLEYPVLSGYLMWLARGVAGLISGGTPSVLLYYATTCALLAACWLGTVYAVGRLVGPRRAALLSASPLLLVHAFTNWDLLAIALAVAALLLWSRGKAGWTGVLIGLGAAAKLFPLFLLGPLLLQCVLNGSVRKLWVPTVLAAIGAWLVVNVPVMVLYPAAWTEFFTLNSSRPPEWNSIYFMIARVTGHSVPVLNIVSFALFALACALIAWLVLTQRMRPTLAEMSFLVICAFLVTNKVWSPQYSLWVLPLLWMLGLSFWAVGLWQAAEVAVWLTLTPLLGPTAGANDASLFLLAAVIRDVMLLGLVLATVRQVFGRRTSEDEPVGGRLESAGDGSRSPASEVSEPRV